MELSFTIKLKEIPIRMTLESGEEVVYKLKELTGQQRDDFLTGMSKRVNINDSSEDIDIKDFNGLQASLVSKSLYDEKNNLVPIDIVQSYPATVVSKLFEESQKLSGLDRISEEEVKNG